MLDTAYPHLLSSTAESTMTPPNLGGRAPLPPVLPQKRAGEEEETDQRGRDPSNGTADRLSPTTPDTPDTPLRPPSPPCTTQRHRLAFASPVCPEKRTQQETSFVSRRGPRPLLLLS